MLFTCASSSAFLKKDFYHYLYLGGGGGGASLSLLWQQVCCHVDSGNKWAVGSRRTITASWNWLCKRSSFLKSFPSRSETLEPLS